MSDDGFHEIQLSGKQLVFLFMATTVVSVVIFLCGVLVGRGVRASQAPELSAFAGVASDIDTLETDGEIVSGPDVDAGGGTAAAIDDAASLSYFERLESEAPVAEHLRATTEPPVPDSSRAPAPPEPTALVPANPGDFTVQVAALRGRDDAQAISDQLSSKGYPAYVLEPAPDAPAAVYRVRVGHYADRAEAEEVRRRLEQEEQFKPWITR